MSLGAKIRKLRRTKNWSQAQFGMKIGVHEKNISRYENDKSIPSAGMLRKIADVLEVTVDYLLSNEDGNFVPAVTDIKDIELLECFIKADQLDEENRAVIKKMVHAFVVQNTVENLAKKK